MPVFIGVMWFLVVFPHYPALQNGESMFTLLALLALGAPESDITTNCQKIEDLLVCCVDLDEEIVCDSYKHINNEVIP